MLQRFPVESKGRRKKLQEVFRNFFRIYICLSGDSGLPVPPSLPFPRVNLPDLPNAGWLCDYHMFFMFPYQMCYG